MLGVKPRPRRYHSRGVTWESRPRTREEELRSRQLDVDGSGVGGQGRELLLPQTLQPLFLQPLTPPLLIPQLIPQFLHFQQPLPTILPLPLPLPLREPLTPTLLLARVPVGQGPFAQWPSFPFREQRVKKNRKFGPRKKRNFQKKTMRNSFGQKRSEGSKIDTIGEGEERGSSTHEACKTTKLENNNKAKGTVAGRVEEWKDWGGVCELASSRVGGTRWKKRSLHVTNNCAVSREQKQVEQSEWLDLHR